MTARHDNPSRTPGRRRCAGDGTAWEELRAAASPAPGRDHDPRGRRTGWAWAHLLGGAAILVALGWRLGTGPFQDAARTLNGWSLAAAAGIAVPTTVCCAWRWSLVAGGLGVDVPLRAAVAGCYRSLFLNTVLPGGVLGDVNRAVRHGRETGAPGRALRAVGWERCAGQVVQLALAVVVLLLFPSPVRSSMPAVATAVVAGGLAAVLVGRALRVRSSSLGARALRAAAGDVRRGLLPMRAWPGILVASTGAVAGHLLTFLVAARTAGSTASLALLLPLAMIVLLAMGVPANIAGWGPREGVSAWAFGAAGMDARQGVTTAVVYGAMVLAAGLPGAGVVVAGWLQRTGRARSAVRLLRPPEAAGVEGAAHG
jgi:glycosyltransferase 2 family protein